MVYAGGQQPNQRMNVGSNVRQSSFRVLANDSSQLLFASSAQKSNELHQVQAPSQQGQWEMTQEEGFS